MNQENTYNITAYDLWSFLQEVQSAVKQGYVLSEKNEHFPQAFVSLYTCTLVKDEPVAEVTSLEVENTTENNEPTKEVTLSDVVANEVKKTAGRKPKGGK